MVITVSIPSTHILHTAVLTPNLPSRTNIATCGQPMQTTLRLSHTRRWASPLSSTPATHHSISNEPIDFVYTLETNPEAWLVAGQRRGQFSAREDMVNEWQIVLIPLKPGVWLLPNVDIRLKAESRAKGNGAQETAVFSCETDYLSYGDTITVLPNAKNTTIGIGEMNQAGGGVVWLESIGVGA